MAEATAYLLCQYAVGLAFFVETLSGIVYEFLALSYYKRTYKCYLDSGSISPSFSSCLCACNFTRDFCLAQVLIILLGS
jgi:hypothetical protein